MPPALKELVLACAFAAGGVDVAVAVAATFDAALDLLAAVLVRAVFDVGPDPDPDPDPAAMDMDMDQPPAEARPGTAGGGRAFATMGERSCSACLPSME